VDDDRSGTKQGVIFDADDIRGGSAGSQARETKDNLLLSSRESQYKESSWWTGGTREGEGGKGSSQKSGGEKNALEVRGRVQTVQ